MDNDEAVVLDPMLSSPDVEQNSTGGRRIPLFLLDLQTDSHSGGSPVSDNLRAT